jgi:hypothetical protein
MLTTFVIPNRGSSTSAALTAFLRNNKTYICVKILTGLYIIFSAYQQKMLSRDRVTTDGVLIGNRIYCTLKTHNYN